MLIIHLVWQEMTCLLEQEEINGGIWPNRRDAQFCLGGICLRGGATQESNVVSHLLHFFLLVFLYDRLMYGVPPRKHSLEEMKFHNKCAV